MADKKHKLTDDEIRAAIPAGTPAILTTKEAQTLLRMRPSTFQQWKNKGLFDGAFRRRGKACLYWRDRLIKALFNNEIKKDSK